MTQFDLHAPTIPPHSRHSHHGSETQPRGLPLVFWPILAMGVMLPVLIVLVVLLIS